jgi:SAM-dependent methyltransferase
MLAPRKTLYSTPLSAFRRALELAQVTADDVVYDLGCGDGRLLVEAARCFGVRAVGVEIHPKRAQQARDAAQRGGVGHLVTVHEANALEFAIPADATVVFLFLISRGLSYVNGISWPSFGGSPSCWRLTSTCLLVSLCVQVDAAPAGEAQGLPRHHVSLSDPELGAARAAPRAGERSRRGGAARDPRGGPGRSRVPRVHLPLPDVDGVGLRSASFYVSCEWNGTARSARFLHVFLTAD